MAKYQILYWHDIPVQVRANDEGGRVNVPLPDRFQEAVDLAASAAGLIDSDDYTAPYHWSDRQERGGSAQQVSAVVATELNEQFVTIDWRATARSLKGPA